MNTDLTLKLSAAMMAPEDQVEPRRARSSSFAASVADLMVGETASRAVQLRPDIPLAEIASSIASLREELRNNVAPAVRRARESVGGTYTVEVEEVWTGRGNLFLVGFVTRVT